MATEPDSDCVLISARSWTSSSVIFGTCAHNISLFSDCTDDRSLASECVNDVLLPSESRKCMGTPWDWRRGDDCGHGRLVKAVSRCSAKRRNRWLISGSTRWLWKTSVRMLTTARELHMMSAGNPVCSKSLSLIYSRLQIFSLPCVVMVTSGLQSLCL